MLLGCYLCRCSEKRLQPSSSSQCIFQQKQMNNENTDTQCSSITEAFHNYINNSVKVKVQLQRQSEYSNTYIIMVGLGGTYH
ncbi:hypothetical protein MHYP_G00237620 [Metynnis hypsauchen]